MSQETKASIHTRTCSACGKSISPARLEVLPDTNLCVECARKFPPEPINPDTLDISQASPINKNGFARSD